MSNLDYSTVTDSAIVGGLLGGDIVGGIIGDLLNN